jgi:hypothetical protein
MSFLHCLVRPQAPRDQNWIPTADPIPPPQHVLAATKNAPNIQEEDALTLFACDDEQERSHIEVPLQRQATTSKYFLTPHAAFVVCSSLGIQGLLDKLNQAYSTSLRLVDDVFLEALLQMCIDQSFDYGVALSFLGPRWGMSDSEALEDINLCQTADRCLQAEALRGSQGDIISNINVPPRRIWDLWSNRVVETWMTAPYDHRHQHVAYPQLFAVSHSWMDDTLHKSIRSNINGQAWPVPLPVDTMLNRIRMELLNYISVRYALCMAGCIMLKTMGPTGGWSAS